MNSYIISDTLFGKSYSYWNLKKFTNRAMVSKPDYVFITGDFMELSGMSFEKIWYQELARMGLLRLQRLAEMIPVIVIPGDRDIGLRKYTELLKPIQIAEKDCKKWGNYTLCHGHQFDAVARLKASLMQYPVIKDIVRVLHPFRNIPSKEEASTITFNVLEMALEKRKSYIIGHIRQPFILNAGEVVVACAGDINVGTFLNIENHSVKLEFLDNGIKQGFQTNSMPGVRVNSSISPSKNLLSGDSTPGIGKEKP